jgi:hypothetical protein
MLHVGDRYSKRHADNIEHHSCIWIFLVSRNQNKEQGAGSRKQKAENREQSRE